MINKTQFVDRGHHSLLHAVIDMFKLPTPNLTGTAATTLLATLRFQIRKLRTIPVRLQVTAIATILGFLFIVRLWYSNDFSGPTISRVAVDDVTQAAQNQTLGFSQAYYISLPQYVVRHREANSW